MPKKISSIDPVWNRLHKNGWGKYPSESLVRFLCRYKNNTKDFENKNRILDLGCGGGANTKLMVNEGFRVHALDGAAEAIKNAKKNVKSRQAKFFVSDFLNLGEVCDDNYFDLVCDNFSIYANSIDHIKQILFLVHKILKHDGLFYSAVFSNQTTPFKNRGTAQYFTASAVKKLYGQYFQVLSLDRLMYTEFDRQRTIDEFILICKKR
ncbi:MAG: class I SAM-dependent methyltransferase [Candidatus Buchananbacteria bacterium]